MDYLFSAYLFVLGLVVGSFLNVVIYRLPRGMSIIEPGSSCIKCRKEIRYRDNIPLLSYIILRGRCRACRAPISYRYPLVELLTGILTLWNWFWFDTALTAAAAIVFTYTLIPVIFIDLEFNIIPNSIIVFGLAAGVLFQISGILTGGYLTLSSFLLGGVTGFGFLMFARIFGRLLFKRESMGMGDIKLGLVLGLFLGLQNVVVCLFLSFVFAAFIGGGLIMLRGKKPAGVIPFGPFLVLGSFAGLYFGDVIASSYYEWIGII